MENTQTKAEKSLIAAYRLFMEEATELGRPPIRLKATNEYLDVVGDERSDEVGQFTFQNMYGVGPWQALQKGAKYYSYVFLGNKVVYNFITTELLEYLDRYIREKNLDPDGHEFVIPFDVVDELHYKESVETWGN